MNEPKFIVGEGNFNDKKDDDYVAFEAIIIHGTHPKITEWGELKGYKLKGGIKTSGNICP